MSALQEFSLSDERFAIDATPAETDEDEFIVSYWRAGDGVVDGVDGRGETLADALQDLAAAISLYIEEE